MKKTIGLVAALLLFLSFGVLGSAEAADSPNIQLEGIIMEVTEDGGYVVDTVTNGDVMVLVSDDTIFEGQENLTVGQYVFVTYNGMMTRSLPPQVHALRIDCYLIDGIVTELDKDQGTMLVDSKEFGLVIVHLPETDTVPQENDFVSVYFNGVMALSYPGQVNGVKVDIYKKASGVVSYIEDAFFLMAGETGTIQVNTGVESRIAQEFISGMPVEVYYLGAMTKSLPPQIFGSVIEAVLPAQ